MGTAALVVVLSAGTTSMVAALARSGWSGPVLVVGSVAEARQALGDGATPGRAPVRLAPPLGAGSPVAARPADGPSVALPGPGPGDGAAGETQGADQVPAGLGIALDEDRQTVVTDEGDCGLTPLEFGVLEALAREPGHAWRFEELTRRVWGTGDIGDWAPVHAVVRRLRRKLQDVHAPVEIVAVRGIGFRLERPVHDTGGAHPANCPSCA